MNNVLDLFDQTVFDGERATGATNLLQVIWVYDRPVDLDGVRRFHRNLQRGRLSRRVQCSPLPFGRHRWVSPGDRPELEIAATPRPRADFDAWLGEQADTPLDAERGPGWHLAVLPFTDGGAGVSLVISHCLTDGVGLCEALADATEGRHDPVSWPATRSRRWVRALREDVHQAASDLPAIGRAVAAAARMARGGGSAPQAATAPAAPPSNADDILTLPTTTVFIDADEWEARAESLGGTSNTLLAGLAARVAQKVGRVGPDGSVALTLPVSERTPGDTRANALTNIDIIVDPAPAAADLRAIRAEIKRALITATDAVNPRWELLPLAPLLPRWLIRRCVGVSAGNAASVVSSNLGAVNPAAFRPDGTDADRFAVRTLGPGITTSTMDRLGGLLVVVLGRTRGEVFISILAYQPGSANSNTELQEHFSRALSDFALTATTGWAQRAPIATGAAK